ncbi:MAG: nickel pincer cofactor biosynthesis protein LarB [Candidatus Syntropharchaeia archaeon]
MEEILRRLIDGEIDIKEAKKRISSFYLKEIEEIARIDIRRYERIGKPEIVFSEDKTPEDFFRIISGILEEKDFCLATRVKKEQVEEIKKLSEKFEVEYNERARTIFIRKKGYTIEKIGKIGIISGGTSDIPVAEEARVVAEVMGCEVIKAYDVGIAGIHRLLEPLKRMLEEDVCAIIVVAGMEGALPSVVSGMVDVPVIGVPTSIGYGVGEKGISALLSMLCSCSPGVAVVNIDNGVGAGIFAGIVARRVKG